MINYTLGNIMNLHQLNTLGLAKASENVVAGMICSLNANGEVIKGAPANTFAGFAMNTQPSVSNTTPPPFLDTPGDGDVISTGKIGLFHSNEAVIGTDVSAVAINLTNYPVGSAVKAGVTTEAGYVTNTGAGRTIGTVYGIETIRGTAVLNIKLNLQ